MLKHRLVALPLLMVILLVTGTLSSAGDGTVGEKITGATGIHGRPTAPDAAKRNIHLLDRGDHGTEADRGGGAPVPLPIYFPGAGPTAVASGFAAGVGAFGTAAGAGAFAGNLFAPGAVPSYPTGFLTGGSVPGFDVTGVYAWHSPFLKTGPVSAVLAGSTRRILAAAAAAVPTSSLAPVAVGPGGFEVVTVAPGGLPGPTGIVGGPGNLAMPVAVLPGGFSAVFCGMAIGGAGFIDPGWIANGIGAVIPAGTATPPPTRLGYPPTFFAGGPFPITAVSFTATPQIQIAGCFAAGATTPVELMAFTVE